MKNRTVLDILLCLSLLWLSGCASAAPTTLVIPTPVEMTPVVLPPEPTGTPETLETPSVLPQQLPNVPITAENLNRLTPLYTLKAYTNDLVFSPDGVLLADAGIERVVRLWQVGDGTLASEIKDIGGYLWSLAFSPDGELLATGSGDGRVRLFHLPDGKLVRVLDGHFNDVSRVAFSPDGSRLASASHDQRVNVWQVTDGKLLYQLKGIWGYV